MLADAKQLPFDAASFPVVISNSIVHHIAEPRDVIAEAIRVTAPGGLLFHRDLARPDDEPACSNWSQPTPPTRRPISGSSSPIRSTPRSRSTKCATSSPLWLRIETPSK